ncbi:hypothetical protein JTB14_007198 [Gonioctena quinquepunctata]|nr:hypothetical protein JTB14_007198 [Gonioctena quinquepunctata]
MEEIEREQEKPRSGRYMVIKRPGKTDMIDWVENTSDPEAEEPRQREESENPKVWVVESDEESESLVESEKHKEIEKILKELREEREEAEGKETKRILEQKLGIDEEGVVKNAKEEQGKSPENHSKGNKKKKGKPVLPTLLLGEKEKPMPCLYPEVIIITRPDGQAAQKSSLEGEKLLEAPKINKTEVNEKPPANLQEELRETIISHIDGPTDHSGDDPTPDTSDDDSKRKLESIAKRKRKAKKRKLEVNSELSKEKHEPKTVPKIMKTEKGHDSITEGVPPPLIVEGTNIIIGNLESEIHSICKQGYRNNFMNGNTHIHITNLEEYNEIGKSFRDKEIGFYTKPKNLAKQNAYVPKGLDDIRNTEEITKALKEEHDLEVLRIYKMRKTSRPLFLVITENQITLEALNGEKQIIRNGQVQWEVRKNETLITLFMQENQDGTTFRGPKLTNKPLEMSLPDLREESVLHQLKIPIQFPISASIKFFSETPPKNVVYAYRNAICSNRILAE